MPFSRGRLERAGFGGWVRFPGIRSAIDIPRDGGVYVVCRAATSAPVFNDVNCGGWFKGKNPSVTRNDLTDNWVYGAECVYIGQSGNLQRRLREFADFGAGKPIGHWGGRLIWQLHDHPELVVAWKATPGELPKTVESQLIQQFRAVYGKPPFANDPHRFGR
jgi:hypothetical protein